MNEDDSQAGLDMQAAIGDAQLAPCPTCKGLKFLHKATYRNGGISYHECYSSKPRFAVDFENVKCPSCRGSGKWIDVIVNQSCEQ